MSFQIGELFNLEYWQQMFSGDLFSLNFLVNILDILVVWYLVYKLIQLLRGTKAIQLLKGVAIFIVIRIAAELIGLHTLSWLMNQVITYGVIAAIVIFQPEIRRGLEHLGRSSLFKQTKSEQQEDEKMILSFDKAIQYMSKRKIGALITIERHTGLDEYIETGIALDADITGELLINIFIPNTPLHDGAVIVKNGKIAVEKVEVSPKGLYDLVFMDIQMPVMNGYEATAAIRSLPGEQGKLPIVAMTANAFAEDVQLAKNTGMNGHIAKPLDMNKLNDVLESWL